ncbi:F0F1 ATP synthase subunit A [Candidatus Saccharibacteria bacterium]|nr:F0F1 ATP synthase subunit A [Candidatus Saccharibacteria bacterium]NIW78282.1 F0F1 ATP synthase subunit A [Calditrichia bacterium]
MNLALSLAASEENENTGLGEWIQNHLQDSQEWHLPFGIHLHLPTFEPINFLGVTIDLSISLHVVMLWIASLILILMFWLSFRKEKAVPTGFAALLESLVLFVRDDIAIPNMGSKNGKKLTPYLCTIFFFILTLNLMGLIPLFTTATGNISVTAGLAIITFVLTQLNGMKENGVVGYMKSLVPGGVPVFLLPIMIPIEFIGLFTKPFALAIRLFANMTAGHTVIFALLGLIIVLSTLFVSPVSIAFALFISILEILIAFIQAYIFTILSALFIGMAMHPEH